MDYVVDLDALIKELESIKKEYGGNIDVLCGKTNSDVGDPLRRVLVRGNREFQDILLSPNDQDMQYPLPRF